MFSFCFNSVLYFIVLISFLLTMGKGILLLLFYLGFNFRSVAHYFEFFSAKYRTEN